jgi:hypothetical protein
LTEIDSKIAENFPKGFKKDSYIEYID